jgi:hypothetical protein
MSMGVRPRLRVAGTISTMTLLVLAVTEVGFALRMGEVEA